MYPLTKVTIFYHDKFGRKWEYNTTWRSFKTDVLEILEKYIDFGYQMYYTVNNETHELDYYNFDYKE